MKKSILIVFCVLLVGKTFAQTSDSLSLTRLRYEVATDLLWLIDKNNVPRTSLFFRYNFRNRPQALRLRIGGDRKKESFKETLDDSVTYALVPRVLQTYHLSLGYEWQTQIKSWQWYGGVEIGYQYEEERYITYPYSAQGLIGLYSSEHKKRTNTVSLAGFTGVKYFIVPRLSVSTELQMLVSYGKNKYKQENLLAQAGVLIRYHTRTWKTYFNPIHVLQISYHF